MAQKNLVKVYESQGIFAAEVVKAKLESVGQVIGITVDGLGRVEVYVSAENAAEALELVEESDDEAPLQEDAAAENGEDLRPHL